MNDIIDLETNGISFIVENKPINVKPILGLILGDNLALNELLGYVMSFAANHPCRICTLPRSEMQKCTSQKSEYLRNEENYNAGLQLMDPSKTGIVSDCEFNRIKSFQVYKNI